MRARSKIVTCFSVVVALLALTGVGQAQQCRDARGIAVAQVIAPDLNDVAQARLDADGAPIILYNPIAVAIVHRQTQLFFYWHECSHHALGHDFSNVTPTQEQAADCYAIVTLVRSGQLSAADMQVVQRDVVRFGRTDATHLPGRQRALNLNACFALTGTVLHLPFIHLI